MPLTSCPECDHRVSTAAEACPECGHPLHPAHAEPSGPKCYACSAAATTRCQRCGMLSCARHLQSIYVAHGNGGAYELRCESCYSSAMTWKVVGFVFFIIIAIIFLIIMSSHSGMR